MNSSRYSGFGYVGCIEYTNGAVDIIHNPEGYALKNGTTYVYHYNLTDHLGNVRATLKRGSTATAVDVVQRDNYSLMFMSLVVFMSSIHLGVSRLLSIWYA
ncbi:hypothetical protein [Sphingobacterium sp. SYP-B4668]|uniref:hypothetical protein n=1 Tax=Sphingobacterium sp. SYP-B4668 TaxID=2996035 RepID=UPI0022DE31B7|nr:hypothetical protein [Sphingobacterium sp. SYP-B4668]